jgi:hypothetical protein
MFDDQKEVTLEGTVKEFQYTNPHSWLLVDVTNKDGSVTTWGFEAEGSTHAAPQRRSSRGSEVRHEAEDHRPSDEGRPPGALWMKAVRDDGKEFWPGGRPRGQADDR